MAPGHRQTEQRVRPAGRRRVLRIVAAVVVGVLVVVLLAGYLIYRHLDANIRGIPVAGIGPRPAKVTEKNVTYQPLNILLLGSDTRKGQHDHIGGATPGLSDTTILLHITANRKHAYAVSIPRDSMVQMPSCRYKNGPGTYPGGLTQFNDAYAIGGAVCTVKTVEHLTHIYMDHFIVIDFNGFRRVVDALGGVQVCVPRAVNDNIGHIHMKAGTYTVDGRKALDYVRLRHVLSENGDIGRMARQQAFLASMIQKAESLGTLTNPVRLVRFLDAVTKSVSADEGLAHLSDLVGLARQLKGIGLNHVTFLTVPNEPYPPDPNRLQWREPAARQLWHRLQTDKLLNHRQTAGGLSASRRPHPKPAKPHAGTHSTANGLCS
jgi:LCP family protein required for cell wall assembly